jgi:hypothetical protein
MLEIMGVRVQTPDRSEVDHDFVLAHAEQREGYQIEVFRVIRAWRLEVRATWILL